MSAHSALSAPHVVGLDQYPISEPEDPPVSPQTFQILEQLLEYCVHDDFNSFRSSLLSVFSSRPDFNIRSLSRVMSKAINLKRTLFVEELFHHGLPMSKCFAYEAVLAGAKEILQIFLKHGWDVNQPMSPELPPVLR